MAGAAPCTCSRRCWSMTRICPATNPVLRTISSQIMSSVPRSEPPLGDALRGPGEGGELTLAESLLGLAPTGCGERRSSPLHEDHVGSTRQRRSSRRDDGSRRDGRPRSGHRGWVGPLCWTAVALEGFDLVVLGVVLPALLQGADLGSDAEHGVAGVRGRTGRRDARRDGRRCHQRHHRSPADCHLDRDRLLGFDAGLRLRHRIRSCSACCGSWPASGSAGCSRRRSPW